MPGDISKYFQSGSKEVNFLLLGYHKNIDIISIKERSDGGSSSVKPLYMSLFSSFSKDVVERVNGQDKESGDSRSPCFNLLSCLMGSSTMQLRITLGEEVQIHSDNLLGSPSVL
jgi:hypothetical protein